MINDMTDNFIPSDQRSKFLANGSYWLSQAILRLALHGGVPPEGKKRAGEEAIELARQALQIHTQLHETERSSKSSVNIASDTCALAQALNYFNDDDDDDDDEEIPRLFQQAIEIFHREQGRATLNVAVIENDLGGMHKERARRAHGKDLDRCIANAELSLPHFHEASRIFRAINNVEKADQADDDIAVVEEMLKKLRIFRAATAATRG